MFVDAINPYGNKISGHHASITFIVMVCLTLPMAIRHRPENVFIVGIAPGPSETSLEQMNWILRPVVNELKTLWSQGLLCSQTHLYKSGRLIRAALLPFIADIPAVRRSLGFPSATATHFCSKCIIIKKDINILDKGKLKLRTHAQHKFWAIQACDSKTVKEWQKIFKSHGVRYSVLMELDYWDVIEYHVVDSMHNLLLGLLAWHVRRFWAMQDVKNEEEDIKPITNVELRELFKEHSKGLKRRQKGKDKAGEIVADAPTEEEDGCNINNASFGNDTSSNDEDFNPFNDSGWKGKWEAPPFEEIVFDAPMLKKVIFFLQRIHIPTWIKRALKVLGKASFGKLKADEWRNLFSIQLPLILIPMWADCDNVKTSLLYNFLHLVSLVNLALKRDITSHHIKSYEHHIQNYLEGCLEVFEHCHLAPNHHMALHLTELLQAFGPVRTWWSFFFERLMGSILNGCHNNHIGQ